MRTSFAISFVIILFNFSSSAQFIHWNTSPTKGFVFEISNKEAEKLLTRSTVDVQAMLHTQVDTFDTRKGWINRPAKGHFILATILENKLLCKYVNVLPYQVFLMKEYDALSLQVVDLDGAVCEDAKVKFRLKHIHLDPDSKTYRLSNEWFTAGRKNVTVTFDGFRSVFSVEKHDVPEWNNNFNYDRGPSFYSYLITDKNKYKPNEKVRLKSFALNHVRSPLRKPLEIWLYVSRRNVKVGTIEPHRPGSYAGEFLLHDSLKLTLDQDYDLQLREKNGRIVSRCSFRYEDYELTGDNLEVDLQTPTQYHPAENSIRIVATDANGLMLKGAKAIVVVSPQTIYETFQPVVILKDTLLITTVDLDPKDPTVVEIPPTLFQKTNITYAVKVRVVNGQNRILEKMVDANYYYSKYQISAHISHDSIVYELLKNGILQQNISATLQHNDALQPVGITLPYKEKINPVTVTTRIASDAASRLIAMESLIPQLQITGGIEKDSFRIQLQNPQNLDVSWFVYQGSELLQKGFGKTIDYRSLIVDRSMTYYVELLYSFAGKDRLKRKEYPFKEDNLTVSLDIPERVYPGQDVDATIHVVNQIGQPVSGVDLTALAVTGKLQYHLPDLQYYGLSSMSRSAKADYSKDDINARDIVIDLDYYKWRGKAGLDTMKYYQFTYPDTAMFRYAFTISDSTQFAPYVMQHGAAKQIYVIEINRRPVYFSWADQPKAYSFYVSPERKVSISLRLFDRVILLDSIQFSKGNKTLLSIDLDHLPADARVLMTYEPAAKERKHNNSFPSFTKAEVDWYTQYLSSFVWHTGTSYLETSRSFTPLFNDPAQSQLAIITVGPVIPGKQTFTVRDGLRTTYQHTGGYRYHFEDNIVYKLTAGRLIPERLDDRVYSPATNMNDITMTKEKFFESQSPVRWHPRSLVMAAQATHLRILLPAEKAASGFFTVLFEDCVTKEIRSFCQDFTDHKGSFGRIPYSIYNLIALYNNGTYLKMGNIDIKPNTKIVVDFNEAMLNAADELFEHYLHNVPENCYGSSAETRVEVLRYAGTPYGNIRGTVYDSQSERMPGVNIIVKGTQTGTATDVNGHFALDSDSPVVTLVVSFIGYKTKEVEVAVGADLSIFLEEDIRALQEVVIVGYGSYTKRDVTGAVSTVLAGRTAGVEVSDAADDDSDEIKSSAGSDEAAEQQLYAELLEVTSIRSHFNDVGFWEPKLFTDRHGESKFNVHFPDDITRWDAIVYAMNRRLQTGTVRKTIKSYKPIIAELAVPQFLTRGDSAFFIGRVINYSGNHTIAGTVKWTGSQSDFEKSISLNDLYTDKLPVSAANLDSIASSYRFTGTDGYLDGEQRMVPVVERGVVRADGTLSILQGPQEVDIKASSDVTIEFFANPISLYAAEARYLLNYKYDCNEQLASKLLGFLNYKLLMKYEDKPFLYDNDVNKIIARLLKNQNQEFLWSWWNISSDVSYWMSAHILRALRAAADAGYKVDLSIENIVRKASYKFDILRQYALSDIELLNALAHWQAPLNYAVHLRKLDSLVWGRIDQSSYWKSHNYSLLKERMLLYEVRQLTKLPVNRDSLLQYRQKGVMGDVSFSDSKPARVWYDDDFIANTIAYRIVRRDSLLKDLTAPMQLYFLSHRKNGEWNTYQSSNILSDVLPDLLEAGVFKDQSETITIKGTVNTTIKKFPYRLDLHPGEELHIKKETGLPVYLMQYRKERVTKAKTGVEGFEIKTQANDNNAILQAGKPVMLTVEVKVTKANTENVMIEIPIPGACSYADKKQYENRVETYREYFKDRTVIFCERMNPGRYTFTVSLLPRFIGKYFINPAQVSLMYVPVVNANTELKKVVVE